MAAIDGLFEAAREGARRLGLSYDRARTCAAGHNARMAKEADSQAPASVADLFKDAALYGDPEAARRIIGVRELRNALTGGTARAAGKKRSRADAAREIAGVKLSWPDDWHITSQRGRRRELPDPVAAELIEAVETELPQAKSVRRACLNIVRRESRALGRPFPSDKRLRQLSDQIRKQYERAKKRQGTP